MRGRVGAEAVPGQDPVTDDQEVTLALVDVPADDDVAVRLGCEPGAVTIALGLFSPVASISTLNPSGAFGQASVGRGTTLGKLVAELVVKGFGKSAGVIR